jgi:hypothetical protein
MLDNKLFQVFIHEKTSNKKKQFFFVVAMDESRASEKANDKMRELDLDDRYFIKSIELIADEDGNVNILIV